MIEPVNADDCRLLLSLMKFAIVPGGAQQRDRVEAWLEAKKAGLEQEPVTITVGGSIWPDERTWAEMPDTIIPAR